MVSRQWAKAPKVLQEMVTPPVFGKEIACLVTTLGAPPFETLFCFSKRYEACSVQPGVPVLVVEGRLIVSSA